MLALLQIISHMIKNLEYSDEEIEQFFTSILDGEYTTEEGLEILSVEPFSQTNMTLLRQNLSQWPEALLVSKMLLEEQ